MTQRGRIQAAVIEAAKQGRFYQVRYRDDGTIQDIDPDGAKLKPQTCLCNETDAEFGKDFAQGRRFARKRLSWTFKLLLTFESEVCAEFFENDVLDAVLSVPKTDTLPGVHLELVDVQYDHPTTQDPANGSRVEYTFEAVEGRR